MMIQNLICKRYRTELIVAQEQIRIATKALKLIADNCDVDWRNLTARNALADMRLERSEPNGNTKPNRYTRFKFTIGRLRVEWW